jgi:hypothetical protein
MMQEKPMMKERMNKPKMQWQVTSSLSPSYREEANVGQGLNGATPYQAIFLCSCAKAHFSQGCPEPPADP